MALVQRRVAFRCMAPDGSGDGQHEKASIGDGSAYASAHLSDFDALDPVVHQTGLLHACSKECVLDLQAAA